MWTLTNIHDDSFLSGFSVSPMRLADTSIAHEHIIVHISSSSTIAQGSMRALTCIDRSFGHPREHRSVRPYTTYLPCMTSTDTTIAALFMHLLDMSSQQSSPTDELVAHSNSPVALHPSDDLMWAESAPDFLEGRLHITSSYLDQKGALQQVFKSLTT